MACQAKLILKKVLTSSVAIFAVVTLGASWVDRVSCGAIIYEHTGRHIVRAASHHKDTGDCFCGSACCFTCLNCMSSVLFLVKVEKDQNGSTRWGLFGVFVY